MFKVALLDQFLSQSYRINVVRCDQDVISLSHLRNDTLQVTIITQVSAFYRVEYRRWVASFLSKLAFFQHVRTSNQLYPQIKTVLLSTGHLHWYQILGTRSVALVAIHDDDFIASVQLVS